MHVEIVIPALNEEQRLPETLARTIAYLARQPYEAAVVVVDNGSVDTTADVVRAVAGGPVPVHLLGCTTRGKGAAVRRGFLTSSARFVGFMDADLATPIETLDTLMPVLESGRPCVIGSRAVRHARRVVPQGVLRRLGGEVFRAAARLVLPGIADTQCGFKFFEAAAVQRVLEECRVDGFSFDLELLGLLSHAGHTVDEVPVVWTDMAGSSFHPVRHGVRAFGDAYRIRRDLTARRSLAGVRVVDVDAMTVTRRPADGRGARLVPTARR